ncbi:polymorphic toxin-type HINT domain-containing protein, partial [Sphaerimonospora cavernae]
VEHDPADTAHGTGSIWTGTAANVTSGADATVTIPAGTLSDGWKIRWRARAVKGALRSDWTPWQTVTVTIPDFHTTTYAYDRNGRMVKQVDANGNVRTFTYDLLGRRTGGHDPDAGDSQQAYDDAGHLLWSTDGKGQKVSHTYDDLGRKTATWSGEPDSGTKLAEWTYDTLAKGKLTSATRYTGGNAYTDTVTGYDNMGRPTGSTLTVPSSEGLLAGTYAFATSYTLTGQIATYTMPAAGGLPAETVTSTYTDLDLPHGMTSDVGGGFTYVNATAYSPTGRLTERAYGAGGKIKRALEWDESTGWLRGVTTSTKADTLNPVITQDDRYTYDISGEITRILDAATASGASPGQSECFTYDGLHRLSQAWTTTATTCGTGTGSTDNQGIDPYAQSFAYDGVGNITGLTDGGQTAAYTYPQAGASAVRPNAVTSITHPTGTDTYAYDAAGQLTSRTVASKNGTLTWNELGQLDKATIDGQDTTMVYDADGERLIRRDPGGKATLYLGSMEIEVNGHAITGKRYYTSLDGAMVAMRIGGDGVTWLMAGLHGSTQLAVNDHTGTVSRERYLPFGQRRGTDDLPFTDLGFLGKVEDDSTGLTYLSARYYDPAVAKFISTDPLLDLRKPQWANPYGYAGNNPIGMSDPSGLAPLNGDCSEEANRAQSSPQCQQILAQEKWNACVAQHSKKWCQNQAKKGAQQRLRELAKAYAIEGGIEEGRFCASGEFAAMLYCINQVGKGGSAEFDWGEALGIVATGLLIAGFGVEDVAAMVLGTVGSKVGSFFLAKMGPKFSKIEKPLAKSRKPDCNSFVPGTEVLLSDGSHKAIEKVEVGDEVLATDPVTGKTEPRPVVALITGQGEKNLVQITVDTDGPRGDKTGTVIATDQHPFWSEDQGHWFNAKDLQPGMRLSTLGGDTLEILDLNSYHQDGQRVYNLTIGGIHAYHVLAGNQAVLVHNTSPCAHAGNYRNSFLKANPGMPKNYQVHHSLPQKYEETMWEAGVNIHENQFLRGVDPGIHSKITTEWRRWERKLGHKPTASEIIRFARYIDHKYGQYFYK